MFFTPRRFHHRYGLPRVINLTITSPAFHLILGSPDRYLIYASGASNNTALEIQVTDGTWTIYEEDINTRPVTITHALHGSLAGCTFRIIPQDAFPKLVTLVEGFIVEGNQYVENTDPGSRHRPGRIGVSRKARIWASRLSIDDDR